MNRVTLVVGIDISKQWLDVATTQSTRIERFEHSPQDIGGALELGRLNYKQIAALVAWAPEEELGVAVVSSECRSEPNGARAQSVSRLRRED